MSFEQEEKVSSRRLEKDLTTVADTFIEHELYWKSVTMRARAWLVFLIASHAITFHRLCMGFYQHNIDIDIYLPALTTSIMLAWYGYAGRCGHLNGLKTYRETRTRALARLSLGFQDKQLTRTKNWNVVIEKNLVENMKITAALQSQLRNGEQRFIQERRRMND